MSDQTAAVSFDTNLNRRIRPGTDPFDHAVSTYLKAKQAVERGDKQDAAELMSHTIDEAQIIHDVMVQWQADLRDFLAEQGVSDQTVRALEARVADLSVLPDGEPYVIGKAWSDCRSAVLDAIAAIWTGSETEAFAAIDRAREVWRRHHDRQGDLTYGYMSLLVEECGEEIVPAMYDRIAGPLFIWRYAKFDISNYDWDEILDLLLFVSLESMRAHLSQRFRDDAPIDVVEHDDRWVVTFDPCGSAGHVQRGDEVEGTPSRLKEPYNFKVIEGSYDWTDNLSGVCIYCNHCQVMMEHMPMDRFGYPVRVIDPPQYPEKDGIPIDDTSEDRQKCSWTMYKSPDLIPEEVWTRCGRIKPDVFGSEHHGGLRDGEDKMQSFLGDG